MEGRAVFVSEGRWLHPLLELEQFLRERGLDASRGEIRDKVVGRASAFLVVRMGVRRVHAALLSRLGKDVLERAGVDATWDELVDEIACRTEGLLREVTDPEEAYGIILQRAEAARRKAPSTPKAG